MKGRLIGVLGLVLGVAARWLAPPDPVASEWLRA
jgi:hypothetical protein